MTYGLVFTYMLPVERPASMEPYFLFLSCGILPWTWFQSSLAEASGVLIAGGNLIKKVLFPAEVLPVVTVLTNLVQIAARPADPGPLPALARPARPRCSPGPAAHPVELVFTLGLALFVSALTVHFRDIQRHPVPPAAPVVLRHAGALPLRRVPGAHARVLRLNPMAHVVVSYQQTLFEGDFDHWRGLGAGRRGRGRRLRGLGAWLFDRLRDTLAEEV